MRYCIVLWLFSEVYYIDVCFVHRFWFINSLAHPYLFLVFYLPLELKLFLKVVRWTELYMSNGTSLNIHNIITEFTENVVFSNVSAGKTQHYEDSFKEI